MEFGRSFSLASSKALLAACVLGLLVSSGASMPASDVTTTTATISDLEKASGETVKTGMEVLEKYVSANIYRIPDTFQADHLYKAMYSLSVMQQYVHLIDALNFTSARLDSFAVVMEQVLSDSCEWINTLGTGNPGPALDCSDPADFVPTLLALGLRPYVNESSSFLTQRYSSNETMNDMGDWIDRTFNGTAVDRSEFCHFAHDVIADCQA